MEAEDKTIKVGDMVMVVKARPCCGYAQKLGLLFIVDNIVELDTKTLACSLCKKPATGSFVFANFYAPSNTEKMLGFQIGQLIKVNPPSIDESVEDSQKLKENA